MRRAPTAREVGALLPVGSRIGVGCEQGFQRAGYVCRPGGMGHTTRCTMIVIPGPVAPGIVYGTESSGRRGLSQRSHIMSVPGATPGQEPPW